MNHTMQQTWSTLLDAGIVKGKAPERSEIESPWYVKILLAFSGWLASLFLLGFVGQAFAFVLKSQAISFIVGGAMIAVAYKFLGVRKNEFYEHLALSISLAGQALIIWSFFKLIDSDRTMFLIMIALLEAGLAIVMPNFIHRVCSSMAAGIALSMTLMSLNVAFISSGILMSAAAWLWLNEFKYPHRIKSLRAIGYGLILALLPLKSKLFVNDILSIWHKNNHDAEAWIQPWMGEMLTSAILLYVVWRLLQRYHLPVSSLYSKIALAGAFILCALSVEAQGITVGVMIILLGFSASNRVLQGLGIISFLYYISSYYYSLDITLIEKAQILLIMGLAMLAARWLMNKYLPSDEEVPHA